MADTWANKLTEGREETKSIGGHSFGSARLEVVNWSGDLYWFTMCRIALPSVTCSAEQAQSRESDL